ncbi:hypothetical protein O3M35_001671 [Rhynocoris fuscipes]|uniref:RPA43 OB domain-containing protein n=1 Tax=Rhynocoris fuscipes TaxID=488301 RepID=A0AAW1CVU5_9HEMI
MFKEKVSFSLPCLKSLIASKNSCVFCELNYKRTLMIYPMHLNNLKKSVREILDSKVTTYDIELGGILLSHKNVKINSSVEMNDEGQINLDYVADIYYFKPQIGSILEGRINKKGRDVLGCLVHSVFNVALPHEDEPKKWIGSKAIIGQTVTFSVVKLDFTGRLPYIRGKLISIENNDAFDDEGADSGMGFQESNDDESSIKDNIIAHSSNTERKSSPSILKRKRSLDINLNTPSPVLKKRKFGNSSDEGVSNEESLNSELSSRKKNKTKHSSNNEQLNITIKDEPIDDNEYNSSKHKKKKKDKKSQNLTATDLESMSSNLLKEALENVKIKSEKNSSDENSELNLIKKSKKRKHQEIGSSKNLENLSDSLLSEAVANINNVKIKLENSDEEIKSKKKKHHKIDNDVNTNENESKTKKKKSKQSVDINEISSALLQEAVQELSIKVEDIKEEPKEIKSPIKKHKKHKTQNNLESVTEMLLEETLKSKNVDEKKRKKHK